MLIYFVLAFGSAVILLHLHFLLTNLMDIQKLSTSLLIAAMLLTATKTVAAKTKNIERKKLLSLTSLSSCTSLSPRFGSF